MIRIRLVSLLLSMLLLSFTCLTGCGNSSVTETTKGEVLDIDIEMVESTQYPSSYDVSFKDKKVQVDILTETVLDPWRDKEYYSGDPCLVVTGSVCNSKMLDLYTSMVAVGYDSDGKEIAWTISWGEIAGTVQYDIPQQSCQEFEIMLNWAEGVSLIKVTYQILDRMIPSSQ